MKAWVTELHTGKNVGKIRGYLAGTDEERVDDIHQMFSDKKVKAIFCLRGGYGASRLLDKIDYKLIQNNPKIFVGFSEITALQMAFLYRGQSHLICRTYGCFKFLQRYKSLHGRKFLANDYLLHNSGESRTPRKLRKQFSKIKFGESIRQVSGRKFICFHCFNRNWIFA